MKESKKEDKVRTITIGIVLSWIIGVIFVLVSLLKLHTTFLGGLLIMLGGIVLLPPTNNILEKKFNIRLSSWLKIVIFVVLVGIGSSFGNNSQEDFTEKVADIEANAPVSSDNSTINIVVTDKTGEENTPVNIESLFPVRAQIGTEWIISDMKNDTRANASLFEKGVSKSYSTREGQAVSVSIYLFKEGYDSSAKYFQKEKARVWEEGGFKEIEGLSDKCYGTDYGGDMVSNAKIKCVIGDIMLSVSVSEQFGWKYADSAKTFMLATLDNLVKAAGK